MRQSLKSPAISSLFNEGMVHGDNHPRDEGVCRRR